MIVLGSVTSTFGCETRRMFGVNQLFDKYCSCNIQGGYVVERVLVALRTRPTSKMSTEMVVETLVTPNIRRGSHPEAEVIH
jgi:hypothetical protein